MGDMRKLKNSRKKSMGHELNLDRWDSNREENTSKLEGNFKNKQNWRYVYKPSWRVSGEILEAILG